MLRWLVIGIGDISRKRVLPAIRDEKRSQLVGLVTQDPNKAKPWQVPGFTSLEVALRETSADAVYIATPVFLHAPQTITCLRAGKHVLCEKPMALNFDEASRMQKAARDCGRLLGIAYYRRHYPKVDRAAALIEAGVIGRPVLAEATSHEWFYPDPGFRDWLVDPRKAGGGPLYDVGSHRIDLMNYLFGKPFRVTGQLSTLVQPISLEDNATVMIEYENGVRGIVDVRWHSRVSRDEFRIRGTKGEIDLTPLNGPGLRHPGGLEQLPPHPNFHFPCIENFVGAATAGEPLRSSGESASTTDWITQQVMQAR